MKTAIKLAFIYLAIQLVVPLLISLGWSVFIFLQSGTFDLSSANFKVLLASQILSMLLMYLYLWKMKYVYEIQTRKTVLSPLYIVMCVGMLLGCNWLLSILMSYLPWVPNVHEETFLMLLDNWWGIATIIALGPVVEECLFRGAITRVLLHQYTPQKAIFISAFIFAVLHLNPAQMIPAFFIGIVFGWVYYRTASLKPVIVMHILNNSIAAWLMVDYPDVNDISELLPTVPRLIITFGAMALVYVLYVQMKRFNIHYNWRRDKVGQVQLSSDDVI